MSHGVKRRVTTLRASGLVLGLLAFSVGSSTACSSGSSDSPGSDDAEQGSSNTTDGGPDATRSGEAPAKDAGPDRTETKDSAPTLDKTLRMQVSIDGEAIDIEKIEVSTQRESDGTPLKVMLKLSYQQIDPRGFSDSTATLSLWVPVAESVGACSDDGRNVTYVYKDFDDRQIYWLGTGYQGGNCSMKVTAGVADHFTAGSITGTLGGNTTKPFSVTWAQPITD